MGRDKKKTENAQQDMPRISTINLNKLIERSWEIGYTPSATLVSKMTPVLAAAPGAGASPLDNTKGTIKAPLGRVVVRVWLSDLFSPLAVLAKNCLSPIPAGG